MFELDSKETQICIIASLLDKPRPNNGKYEVSAKDGGTLIVTNLHCWVLQLFVFMLSPLHFFPPPDGGGLVHVRFIFLTPPPHVLSQGPGLPQEDQFPSTPKINAFSRLRLCPIDRHNGITGILSTVHKVSPWHKAVLDMNSWSIVMTTFTLLNHISTFLKLFYFFFL